MGKVKTGNNVFIPMPMAIVGAMNGGAPNFMAVGWNTRANADPPMVVIGIGRSHLTHECIVKTGCFSLNIPGTKLLAATDYAGLVSGRQKDKSGIFEVFYGENPAAPLVRDAAVCLECRVADTLALPTNTLFVGEITGAWCEEDCLTDRGAPDFRKSGCYFLTMPDNSYWGLGEYLGRAWSEGKDFPGS